MAAVCWPDERNDNGCLQPPVGSSRMDERNCLGNRRDGGGIPSGVMTMITKVVDEVAYRDRVVRHCHGRRVLA